MIISLRGTSGSGKSTLVRKITRLYDNGGHPIHVDGRRKAYYTIHSRRDGNSLVVPGHYDIPNGGVDTLRTLDQAYEIARRADEDGCDVLMEGKCMSDGVSYVVQLHRDGRDVRVVHLHHHLEKCVAAVRERGHNIARHSIERTHEKVLRDVRAFREHNVRHVVQEGREECFRTIREWLGL